MTHTMATPPIPGARVLVVDDSIKVRSALARVLNQLGYRADKASSGQQAVEKLKDAPYDVMVLDIRMPGMDGIEVMRRAHDVRPDLAIIVLTGYPDTDSAIAAVKSAAVDYLRKPASASKLATAVAHALEERVESLHHQHLLEVMNRALSELRGVETSGETLTVRSRERFLRAGSVTLDLERRLATVAGVGDSDDSEAELTAGENALLAYLMGHPNQVLSCHELARSALDYAVDEARAGSIVRPYVYRLRRKLEADPSEPSLIRTVRGRGYIFAP